MEGDVFVVNVTDNGRGFDPGQIPVRAQGLKGHGLENISRRMKELGGDCCIERHPGGGTRVSLRLPIVKEEK
jgi:signal transduction histidine kinase